MSLNISILTLQWALNVGAYLQLYSLFHILSRIQKNVNVEIINYIPKPHSQSLNEKIRERGFIGGTKLVAGRILDQICCLGFERRKKILFEKYLNNLKLTEPVIGLNELFNVAEKFDTIVVGSDWVWSPEFPMHYHEYAYLLPFKLKTTLKVAYSASFGIDTPWKVPSTIQHLYGKYIRDFDFVSLREKSHIPFLSKLIKKPVYNALDPVFLTEKMLWEHNLLNVKIPDEMKNFLNEDYIFIYNLEPYLIFELKSLLSIFQRRGYKVVIYKLPRLNPIYNFIKDISSFFTLRLGGIKFAEYIGPYEFILIISNSKYVITDSFHGTAFSIIFEKPFVSISRPKASIRIRDLLDLFKLQNRFVYYNADAVEISKKLEESIDFKPVALKLEYYRRKSLELLRTSLVKN